MPRLRSTALLMALVMISLHAAPTIVRAADEAEDESYLTEEPKKEKDSPDAEPAKKKPKKVQKRKYFTDDSPRTDAGVFHVAATVGGNMYIEPEVNNSNLPTGNFHKDFGFAAGVTFDYDYSELDENIPLMLRGFVGYKYVLSSVHVATFDGIVRRMWHFSEKSSFGLGFGGSAAVWYRVETLSSTGAVIANEEIIFLPSFIMEAGFDFNPFMIDIRLLINRIKGDSSILGGELYFGFRL